MVHNTSTGCQDNVTELTGGQQLDDPLLKIAELDVVTRTDAASFVQSTVQQDDYLAVAVIIDLFEFSDISCERISMLR